MNRTHVNATWPAPKTVSALSTTRVSGFSQAPYDSNNLALHVEDNEEHVLQNRQALVSRFNLPTEPRWLTQTHSTRCLIAEEDTHSDADAALTRSLQHPLVILTADCLPITLCNRQGTEIAAIHAGWKGLFNGIIENTLAKMHSDPKDLLAWIGPAISQKHYEVGHELYDAFTGKYPECAENFIAIKTKWLANLPKIAELVLNNAGVHAVYQSGLCTFELNNEFYSYRKTPQTGRIATLIWMNTQPQD